MEAIGALLDGITYITDWIGNGLYTFMVESYALLVEYLTLASLTTTLWAMSFGWDVAKAILENFGLSELLNDAWSYLDSKAASLLIYLNVPEAINMLTTAFVTKFTMRFIPFA